MLHEWEAFYLIVGSAPAALIGLMFVVITLTNEADRARVAYGARAFLTPIVVHFSIVLVVGALTQMPGAGERAFAALLGLAALIGFGYGGVTSIRLFRGVPYHPDWEDRVFYGLAPTAAYIALAFVAAEIWLGEERAAYVLAAIMLGLLVIGIRNAWDLATYLTLERRGRQESTERPSTPS